MKNIKLSAAQQKVMDKAYKDIQAARECATVEEWFIKYIASIYNSDYNTPEKQKEKNINRWNNVIVKAYNDRRQGIVLTHCSSKTLEKLEKLGLIKICHDSKGEHYGIDEIQILDI